MKLSSMINKKKLFLSPVTVGKMIIMSQLTGTSITHRKALNGGKGSFFLNRENISVLWPLLVSTCNGRKSFPRTSTNST